MRARADLVRLLDQLQFLWGLYQPRLVQGGEEVLVRNLHLGRRSKFRQFLRNNWEQSPVLGEDMKNRVGGRFSKVVQRFREVVGMVHPSYIVCSRGNFEGGRWNGPHDIRRFDSWDEQVVSGGRHGRCSAVEGN